MTGRPILSGHCNTENRTPDPEAAHARCMLPECACPRHQQAPVPVDQAPIDDVLEQLDAGVAKALAPVTIPKTEVSRETLRIATGRRKMTLACLQGNHGACRHHAPGDHGCGCTTCEPSPAAESDTEEPPSVVVDDPALAMGRAIADAEGRRVEVDLKAAGVPDNRGIPGAHNHAFTRDVDGILRCGCGGYIDPEPPPAGTFVPPPDDTPEPLEEAAALRTDPPVGQACATDPGPVVLTDEDRRRIVAVMLNGRDPQAAYDTVAAIIAEHAR